MTEAAKPLTTKHLLTRQVLLNAYEGRRRGSSHALEFLFDHANWQDVDDCLIWPFKLGSSGYGRVHVAGLSTYAHRMMCLLAHGDPTSFDLQAAHSCSRGHKGCVNPRHLRWATAVENAADIQVNGRSTAGANNYLAKLTDDDVRRIRRADYSAYGSVVQMARLYGMAVSTLNLVRAGKTYKNVS